jgi:hypothetical protein
LAEVIRSARGFNECFGLIPPIHDYLQVACNPAATVQVRSEIVDRIRALLGKPHLLTAFDAPSARIQPQQNSVSIRILGAAKAYYSGAVAAWRNEEIFFLFVEAITLRKVPERSERSVEITTSKHCRAGVGIGEVVCPLGPRFLPCRAHRKGWCRTEMHRRLSEPGGCGSDPREARHVGPRPVPTDRSGHRFPGLHIATPRHAATAFQPNERKRAHPQSRPRSPACCPNHRGKVPLLQSRRKLCSSAGW